MRDADIFISTTRPPVWPAGRSRTGAACAVAQFGIAPRIEALRLAIGGPVDALDASDPRRMAFGRMHGMSVMLMGIGMVAAFVALVILARHLSSPSLRAGQSNHEMIGVSR